MANQGNETGRVIDWVFTVMACTQVLVFSGMCTFVLPGFAGVFEDIGSGELPVATRFFISVPRIVWIPAGLAVCATLIGKSLVLRQTRIRAIIAGVAFALAMCALGVFLLATYGPLLQIVERIGT